MAAIPQQPKFTTDRLKNIHYHHCQSGRPSVIFSTHNYDTQVNAYHKEEDNEEEKVPLCVHTHKEVIIFLELCWLFVTLN